MNGTFPRTIVTGWNMASALSALLREEMKRRRMEQGPFAELIGVAPSQMSALLNNPHLVPKLETLDQIAERLGRDLGDLIVAVGYALDQDKERGRAEQVALLLESTPELQGFFDDLMLLRPEDLRQARAFVQGVLGRPGGSEASEG